MSFSSTLRKFACFLLILGVSFQGIRGQAVRGQQNDGVEVVTKEYVTDGNGNYAVATVRRLEETVIYGYTVQFTYTFPEEFVPADGRLAEIRDGVRLTQIFYRRLLAAEYPLSYLQATCSFEGTEADIVVDIDALGRLILQIDVSVTTTYRARGDIPTPSEAFTTVSNFDRTDLIVNFLQFAKPGDFFPFVIGVQAITDRAPTPTPSALPTRQPSIAPTNFPTSTPSSTPTGAPSALPTSATPMPTASNAPSNKPTSSPQPSDAPSQSPSVSPTKSPEPSMSPSRIPSAGPSESPSAIPTPESNEPSTSPSRVPSMVPSFSPSMVPSLVPSSAPSMSPSNVPSLSPSSAPSRVPSSAPSFAPSDNPGVTVGDFDSMMLIEFVIQFSNDGGLDTNPTISEDQRLGTEAALIDFYNTNLADSNNPNVATFISDSATFGEFPANRPTFLNGFTTFRYTFMFEITTSYENPRPTSNQVQQVMEAFSASGSAQVLALMDDLDGVFSDAMPDRTISMVSFDYSNV